MTITAVQKAAAKALVSVFETGRLPTLKGYATVTNIAGDSGGLTYGIHQVTINSGNLYLLLKAYDEAAGKFSAALHPYLDNVLAKDRGLAADAAFKGLLRQAGLEDPIMRETQEIFFDRVFWTRAADECRKLGLTHPLSHAVVYDSCIHGSFARIVTNTLRDRGTVGALGETAWIKAYNEERYEWLANNSNPVLRTCVYRQRAFRTLFALGKWTLDLPFTVRLERNKKGGGTTFEPAIIFTPDSIGTADDLTPVTGVPVAPEPVRTEAGAETGIDLDRLLFVPKTGDLLRGDDVKAVQRALAALGYSVLTAKGEPDGVYGKVTAEAVRLFQKKNGMNADSIVGNATLSKLGIN